MKPLIIGAVLFTLGGCGIKGAPESFVWHMDTPAAEKRAYFERRCASYGFEPGTTAMAECVGQETRQSMQNARAIMSQPTMQQQPSRPCTSSDSSMIIVGNCYHQY